jgi:hypothetical protein
LLCRGVLSGDGREEETRQTYGMKLHRENNYSVTLVSKLNNLAACRWCVKLAPGTCNRLYLYLPISVLPVPLQPVAP